LQVVEAVDELAIINRRWAHGRNWVGEGLIEQIGAEKGGL
jgi:hypothetical protein